ncbi:Hypothetical predicted protein, partial [Xyrichtys novacula]
TVKSCRCDCCTATSVFRVLNHQQQGATLPLATSEPIGLYIIDCCDPPITISLHK